MMAGPFIIDETIKWIFPKGKAWLERNLGTERRRQIEVALMIFGVFLAGFFAFNDEHAERIKAENAVSQINNRAEVRKKLREFFVVGGTFIEADLPKDISEENFKAYEANADQWANSTANWIAWHLGQGARAKFLDKSSVPTKTYDNAVNVPHNNLLNGVAALRTNLSTLIETGAWDDKK
jgi:hypothetical protein